MKILVLPVLLPLLMSLVLALIREHWRLERALSVATSGVVAVFSFWLLGVVDGDGIQITVLGGWQAPWGVALVADRTAAILLCLSASLAVVAVLHTCWTVTPTQQQHFFYPLFQVLVAGVNWAFLTGDLFNLFVAYEVMLTGSYAMLLTGASAGQIRAALKYMALNAIGSALFVAGCGLVYATLGTLNFADMAARSAQLTGVDADLVTAVSMILFTVFVLKAAAFPVFFWLPDSYPQLPDGINGFVAGLLTKVGIYSLLRLFVMVFRQEGAEFALELLLWLAAFTMVLGVMGAMCQWQIRRILAWHSISQVGYMIMGIGLASHPTVGTFAVVGTLLFVVHHSVVKSSLFLLGSVVERVCASRHLQTMGGTLTLSPTLGWLFGLSAFSLAGIPPLSGFLAKLVLVRAGLMADYGWLVAAALVTGFLTLYSMVKIWNYAFWGKPVQAVESVDRERLPSGLLVPGGILTVATLLLGLAAEPFLALAERAATTLLHPETYIEAVLGDREGLP